MSRPSRLALRRHRLGVCSFCLEAPIRLIVLTAALALLLTLAPAASPHGGYRSVPKKWSARLSTPRGWFAQALCIHSREGAWNASTGNGYEGGMQFLASTWLSAGGRIDRSGHWASVVSPREQLYRSFVVWLRDGRSWREWGTARGCGLA